MMNYPEHTEWRDACVTTTTVHLSLWDRLKLLWSGRVRIETRTQTENVVGWTRDDPARVEILPRRRASKRPLTGVPEYLPAEGSETVMMFGAGGSGER